MITEWNIQSRAHGCEACGKSFADKEPYHTLLIDEKSEFHRSDVCTGCWQTKFGEASGKANFISHWQGVYHAPPPPSEPVKKETAEALLRKLIELNDPQYIPAGYILAVMLERKRILKVKEQFNREDKRVFVYEHPKTGDIFTIVEPQLRLDQLEQIQRDVATLLEHGLNPPPAAVENPPAPAETAETPSETAVEEAPK